MIFDAAGRNLRSGDELPENIPQLTWRNLNMRQDIVHPQRIHRNPARHVAADLPADAVRDRVEASQAFQRFRAYLGLWKFPQIIFIRCFA